ISTRETATCTTTSILSARPAPPETLPPPCRSDTHGSVRSARHAGIRPKIAPAITATATVNATTLPSSGTSRTFSILAVHTNSRFTHLRVGPRQQKRRQVHRGQQQQ